MAWRSTVHGKMDWVSNVAWSAVRRPNVPWSNGGSQITVQDPVHRVANLARQVTTS